MRRTLNGLRVLNTRPQNQAQALSKSITDAGGIAIECPTIEIRATSNSWLGSLPPLSDVNQAIFVSANAVHHCFSQLKSNNIHWPTQIKVIAIGHGTAKALHELHIQVNDIPEAPNSEHLLILNTLQEITNQTVLLFKGEGGRELIEEGLLQRGAKLITLDVYKRVLPQIRHQFINSLWRDDLVDIILLTSEQSIRNLFKMFNKEAHYWLQEKPCLVISDRLGKAASLSGMKKIIISHPDWMMNTLLDYNEGLIHGQ
ncbi:uroporphyrinogen-III synthase [Legionella maioricensis]|uniref:Uroporphyrinogen-III synthase n=1 Tax=Legionella maioricensis TaxID=2896528 RepID=A0A9X2D5C6_9GAMM|nr:uroporphyrinogen-III synthase [Legionella maioricensis]MCL9685797.1 uroporphyrinogen-III synthase [Legionella maioricensis]MCL9689214.1 uroporphyrinogen-III synthase [Legionella maioricensis]